MKTYPEYYLRGNIELQEEIEKCQSLYVQAALRSIAVSIVFFMVILISVTFEIHGLSIWAFNALVISGFGCYFAVSDLPLEFQ